MTSHPGAGGTAAFFDVDGTLVDATIVHYFVYFRRRCMSGIWGTIWYAAFLCRCLYFLLLDSIDRGKFNIVFYRSYRGLSVERIRSLVKSCHEDVVPPRRFPEAWRHVQQHKRNGDRVVFVSGSVDFLLAPLAAEVGADVLATSLLEHNGSFTGEMGGPPMVEQQKARRMVAFANEHGIDLTRSYAYGDSVNDLAMLEAVGFPHAINPDKALSAIARQRSWPVHLWTIDPPEGRLPT